MPIDETSYEAQARALIFDVSSDFSGSVPGVIQDECWKLFRQGYSKSLCEVPPTQHNVRELEHTVLPVKWYARAILHAPDTRRYTVPSDVPYEALLSLEVGNEDSNVWQGHIWAPVRRSSRSFEDQQRVSRALLQQAMVAKSAIESEIARLKWEVKDPGEPLTAWERIAAEVG